LRPFWAQAAAENNAPGNYSAPAQFLHRKRARRGRPYKLLIIDEIGYLPMSREQANLSSRS
jgi:hypothetical protein